MKIVKKRQKIGDEVIIAAINQLEWQIYDETAPVLGESIAIEFAGLLGRIAWGREAEEKYERDNGEFKAVVNVTNNGEGIKVAISKGDIMIFERNYDTLKLLEEQIKAQLPVPDDTKAAQLVKEYLEGEGDRIRYDPVLSKFRVTDLVIQPLDFFQDF